MVEGRCEMILKMLGMDLLKEEMRFGEKCVTLKKSLRVSVRAASSFGSGGFLEVILV